jgi:hypothetical protein
MEQACEKYEEWGNGFVLLIVSLMLVWIVLGVGFMAAAGVGYAVLFAALCISVAFSAFYLTCRHCYYYGKKCYLAIGLVVPHFFAKVEGTVAPWRPTLWFVHLFVAIAFPLVFIFREASIVQGTLYSLVYLAAPLTAIFAINRYCCPRCKHTGCVSNPDRKKATTLPVSG